MSEYVTYDQMHTGDKIQVLPPHGIAGLNEKMAWTVVEVENMGGEKTKVLEITLRMPIRMTAAKDWYKRV